MPPVEVVPDGHFVKSVRCGIASTSRRPRRLSWDHVDGVAAALSREDAIFMNAVPLTRRDGDTRDSNEQETPGIVRWPRVHQQSEPQHLKTPSYVRLHLVEIVENEYRSV